MKRKSIGNKLRFEVLKRDYFSCHYCGAKPPDVRLEVDHMVPVARGGSTDIDNLVAACTRCNRGKCAVPLSERLSPAITVHEIRRRLAFRIFDAVESGDPKKLTSARMNLFKFNWCESFGYAIVDNDVWPSTQWSELPKADLVEEALLSMSEAELESILIEVYLERNTLRGVRPCDYANHILCIRLGKEATDELASN